MKPSIQGTLFSLLLAFCLPPLHAEEVKLAVAANFSNTIKTLSERFERESGHKVVVSMGATGKFYTQIRQGAPFDVLLAADSATPQKLADDGATVIDSRRTYAIGQLVLWSANKEMVDAKGQILTQPKFQHLALAQPRLAPYGLAARQALEKLQLWDKLQSRLVFGENVGQTQQFIATGNAELGFVALAQIKPGIAGKAQAGGSYWLVPAELYDPIRQQMVILNKAHSNKAAHAFWRFMQSPVAQEIIRADGYGIEP